VAQAWGPSLQHLNLAHCGCTNGAVEALVAALRALCQPGAARSVDVGHGRCVA